MRGVRFSVYVLCYAFVCGVPCLCLLCVCVCVCVCAMVCVCVGQNVMGM